MRIYVAARDVDLADLYMGEIRARGHVITHDWVVEMREKQARGVRDWDLSDQEASAIASADLAGVASADLLVLLAPEAGGVGCWVELGHALGRGVPVVCVGPGASRTVFTRHPRVRCVSDLSEVL